MRLLVFEFGSEQVDFVFSIRFHAFSFLHSSVSKLVVYIQFLLLLSHGVNRLIRWILPLYLASVVYVGSHGHHLDIVICAEVPCLYLKHKSNACIEYFKKYSLSNPTTSIG